MRIRFANIEDVDAIATVNYVSWQETYRGIVEDSFLDSLNLEQYEAKWLAFFQNPVTNTFILVIDNDEGKVSGYCCAGKMRKGLDGFGAEIYALYLLKEFQGKGFGKSLFKHVIKEFVNRGFDSCCLFVLKDNPSVNFYRSFNPDVEEVTLVKLGEREYSEFRLGWSDLKSFNDHSI